MHERRGRGWGGGGGVGVLLASFTNRGQSKLTPSGISQTSGVHASPCGVLILKVPCDVFTVAELRVQF